MTVALNLADYQADPKPLVAGVAKCLREESRLMDVIPFPTTGALGISVLQEGDALPAPTWRQPGSSHGSVVASRPGELTERAYSIGNEIQVDKVLMKDSRAKLYDPFVYQTKKVTKAIARTFAEKILLGVPTEESNPVGLYHRIWNDLGASQRILAGSGGLDISPDATTLSTQVQTFIDKLDELIFGLKGNISEDNGDVYLLTNDTVLLRVQSVFRQSGMLNQAKDILGRTFVTYKGAKFIDVGYKVDDTTRIMTNAENVNGYTLSGGACSSIIGVRLGNEYFTGWQQYALDVSDLELQSDKVTYKSVIDWSVGISVAHPRHSVAQLYGLIVA